VNLIKTWGVSFAEIRSLTQGALPKANGIPRRGGQTPFFCKLLVGVLLRTFFSKPGKFAWQSVAPVWFASLRCLPTPDVCRGLSEMAGLGASDYQWDPGARAESRCSWEGPGPRRSRRGQGGTDAGCPPTRTSPPQNLEELAPEIRVLPVRVEHGFFPHAVEGPLKPESFLTTPRWDHLSATVGRVPLRDSSR